MTSAPLGFGYAVMQRRTRSQHSSSDVCFHLIDDRGERRLVHDSHVCQHLAIEFDRSALQAVHELAVGQAVLTRCRVDTGDPQCAEYAFLVTTIAVSILSSTHDRLLGDAIDLAAATTVAFGLVENFLVTGACGNPTFDSRHDCS